jgi:hypothetical protein
MQLGVKKGTPDMFLEKPELLEQAELAVWSACEFWKTRGLNDAAKVAFRIFRTFRVVRLITDIKLCYLIHLVKLF